MVLKAWAEVGSKSNEGCVSISNMKALDVKVVNIMLAFVELVQVTVKVSGKEWKVEKEKVRVSRLCKTS